MLTVAAAPPDINRLQPLNSGPASNQAVLTTPSDEDTQRNNKLMNKLTHLLERTDEKSSDLKQLSPKQRKAAAKLIEQTGSDIRLRVRQGSKTIRYLKVADSDKRLKMSTHKVLTDEVRKQVAQDFLSEHKALLSINVPEEEFVLFSQNTDDLGYSHLRYHQQYNQIPIWPSDATVHLDSSGNVSLFEGTYIATPSRVASTPVVTADDAMVKAKAAVPDADNATVSQAELIYFALDDKPVRLAWKQEVNVSDSSRWLVVIDALDGSVLTAFNEVMNANIVGSGTDLLGVKRPLNVWNQSGKYYLIDTSKKMYDKSSNPPDGDVKGAIIVVDANHNAQGNDGSIDLFHITSNNPNSWPLSDGVSASFWFIKNL
ncbi:hypothetical protein [Methylocucumis oryzae]|uniref:hypothetical protein n=1 Tax=Methylocucumis oryzae TaxID=1632867 RepID=UPI00103E0DBB|nr:hypothetical protein [Methylocucumis oryzae]